MLAFLAGFLLAAVAVGAYQFNQYREDVVIAQMGWTSITLVTTRRELHAGDTLARVDLAPVAAPLQFGGPMFLEPESAALLVGDRVYETVGAGEPLRSVFFTNDASRSCIRQVEAAASRLGVSSSPAIQQLLEVLRAEPR